MPENNYHKILFIINPGSGKNSNDWPKLIGDYFNSSEHEIELFELPADCSTEQIKNKIADSKAGRVVAVGGDGTIKLVAECLMDKKIPLGVLPAGSANGLAKELGITEKPEEAMAVLKKGFTKKIHLTKVNDHICIHLSDIGFNANAMKTFEEQQGRGMWGYMKAFAKVFRTNPVMEVEVLIDKKPMKLEAVMIVIANGTKYGTGALINPVGRLDDDKFEVIAIKKISLSEIFKMTYSHKPYDFSKTSVHQVENLRVKSLRNVHFQVDGEYLGKVKEVNAHILCEALEIIVPE